MRNSTFIGLAIFALALTACSPNKNETTSNDASIDLHSTLFADTIKYDVLIKNPDTTNYWISENLKNLQHKKMVDNLFENVYSEKVKVFDFYNLEPLTIKDIKEIESRYPREQVGKLQFTETWIFNNEQLSFSKKTHSILIAYEAYNDFGDLRGYKAGFLIQFPE